MTLSLQERVARLEQKARHAPFNLQRHVLLRRSQLLLKQTRCERKINGLLSELELRFISQKGFIAGGVCYVADFYLPRPYRLVIEVDGPSHRTEEGMEKDKRRDTYFKSRRFRVLHISNEQAWSMTANELMELIEASKLTTQ
jgi:very-short-patch-repair endonuclease